MVYLPLTQQPPGAVNLLVKTAAGPTKAVPEVRREVAAMLGPVPTYGIRPLRDYAYWGVWQQRMIGFLLTVFGFTAIVLAVLGIYGVISYLTSLRHQELATRMALGARRGDLVRLVVGQGMVPALLGTLIGLALGVVVARALLADYLFEVSPFDPWVLGGSGALALAAAFFATYLPARRQAALNPADSLRAL
jgi:putative ABC transport system permease protein